MYSPLKAHIQELLTRNLREWVDDFDDTSLNIGLWNGNIELANLVLKRKSWEVGGGLCASLELARIDSIKVIVPWTKLATGNIEIEIGGCQACVRVHSIEEDERGSGAAGQARTAAVIDDEPDLLRSAGDTASHARVRERLDAEDLRILGAEADHSTWASKILQSLSSNLLSRIAAGFTLRAADFKISVLLPLSAAKYTHLRAFLTSVDTEQVMEPDAGKSSSSQFLAKSLNVRGLAIAIDSNLYSAQVSFEDLLRRPLADAVLNPLNIFANISGRKEKDAAPGAEAAQPVLAFQLQTSNLEISPFFGQLTAINELTKYISSSRLRFQLRSLRRTFSKGLLGDEAAVGESFAVGVAGPASTDDRRRQLREMWAYGVKSIVLLRRGDGGATRRLALRRRYIELYLQQVTAKVGYYAKSKTLRRSKSQKANAEASLLSERDNQLFDGLCGYFSAEALVLFRYIALCRLHRRGEDLVKVRAALLYFTDHAGAQRASGQATPTLSAPRAGIDAEIMRVLSPPAKDKPLYRPITWIVEMSISRMALIIRESAVKGSSAATRAGAPGLAPPNVLTLVFYGVSAKYDVTEADTALAVTVGSCRLHSGTNVDLLACGGAPDSWVNGSDGGAPAIDLRLRAQLLKGARDDRKLPGTRRAQSGAVSRVLDGSKRHTAVELTVEKVKVHWDDDSVLYLLTFYKSFLLEKGLNFERRIEVVRSRASMHLFVKGVEVAVPCHARSGSSSGPPADNALVFDIGKLTLAGGDFLTPAQRAPSSGAAEHPDDGGPHCSIAHNRQQAFCLDDDGYPTRSEQEPQGALSDTTWSLNTHEQLQDIIFGGKALASSEPYLFHVMNCTLAMVPHSVRQHDSSKRVEVLGENLLLVPWNIGGVVFRSTGEAAGGSAAPQLTVDVFFSSLSSALSLQNILDMINVGDFLYSTFAGSPKVDTPIRLASLSATPTLRVSAKFDDVFLAIISERKLEQDVAMLLETFGVLVRQRGHECPCVRAQRRLAINRLAGSLGADYDDLDDVFRALAEAALDPTVALKDAVAAAEERLRLQPRVRPDAVNIHSILQIRFKRVYLSALALSYDFRVGLKVYEVSLVDMLQRPILMIINKKVASREALWEESSAHRKHRLKKELKREAARKKENDLSSLDTSRGAKSKDRSLLLLQKESDLDNLTDKQLAVNLTLVDQDAEHGWGKGGVEVADLYRRRKSLVQRINRRVQNISYESFGVNFFFSEASIMRVFETLIPVLGTVREHMSSLQERKRASEHQVEVRSTKKDAAAELFPALRARVPNLAALNADTLARTETVVHCNFSVSELSVVLARGDDLLSQLQLQGIEAALHSNKQLEELFSGNIVASDLQYHDLSATSKLYTAALWKERGAANSVLQLSVSQKQSASLTQTYYMVDVTALRACFLSKHVEEVAAFIAESFVQPAAEMLSRSSMRAARDRRETEEGRDGSAQRGVSPVDEESSWGSDSGDSSDSSSDSSSDEEARVGTVRRAGLGVGFSATRSKLWGATRALGLAKIIKGVGQLKTTSARRTSEEEPARQVVLWCVELKHTTVYLPRNSHSLDVVGVSFTHARLETSWLEESWPRLTSPSSARPGHTLHFDPVANAWADRSDSSSETPQPSRGSRGSGKKASFLISPLDVRRGSQESCEGEFFDAQSPLPARPDPFALSSPHLGKVSRLSALLSNITVHTSFDTPPHLAPVHELATHSYLRFLEVGHDEPVHAGGSEQRWYQATNHPFHLRVVLDVLPDGKRRTLLCDSPLPSSLDISLSMAELCLLQSIYFDNMHETTSALAAAADAPPDPDPRTEKSFPLYGTREYIEFVTGLHKSSESLVVLSEVSLDCSMDINYFEKPPASLESLTSNASPSAAAELRDYFAYTRRLSEAGAGERWAKAALPLGLVTLKGLVINTQAGADAVQSAGTASFLEIHDKRIPSATSHPLVLSVKAAGSAREAGRVAYYPPDMLYGWSLLPSSVQQPSKEPLTFSYTNCVNYNWATTNLGVDRLNLDFKQLDIFLLFTDYFACYHLYAEYGHPAQAVLADAQNKPYTGSDFRLFATSPLVSIKSEPLAFHSPTLVLQSDRGVFYRQTQDSKGSRKIELSAYDLAVVVFKRYVAPERARGMRGLAGSTGGLHTVLEFFNVALNYHYDCEAFTTDLFCNVFPDHDDDDWQYKQAEGASAKGIDSSFKGAADGADVVKSLDAQQVHVKLPDIVEPRSVFPLSTGDKIFPPSSCDVVISYDDVLFIAALLTDILGVGKPRGAADPQKASTGLAAADAAEADNPCSLFCGLSVGGVKVIVVDSVLGLHLPLFQVFLPDLTLYYERASASRERQSERAKQEYFEKLRASRSRTTSAVYKFVGSQRYSISRLNTESTTDDNQEGLGDHDSLVHVYARFSLWVDYFNNMRKCWEPFLERFESCCCYEDVPRSGVSVLLRVLSDVHINWSTACLRALDDFLLMVRKGEGGARRGDGSHKGVDTNTCSSRSSAGFGTPESGDCDDDAGGSEEVMQMQIPADNVRQIPRARSKASLSARQMVEVRVLNLPSPSLGDHVRVGFSIRNLTGQCLRYLQKTDDGSHAIQYLDDNTRGLLNFLASATTVRNNHVVEESLGVQMRRSKSSSARASAGSGGHQVALQISGFNWLAAVQADELGIRYESLVPVLGRVNAVSRIADFSLRYKMHNALKLISEVVPHNGGRMLVLRSAFTIRNYTRHAIRLLCATEEGKVEDDNTPFVINSGDSFHVPLALLDTAATLTEAKSLGCVYMRPHELAPIDQELQGMPQYPRPGNVEFTSNPINIYDIVTSNSNLEEVLQSRNVISIGMNALGTAVNAIGNAMADKTVTASENIQLCCRVDPRSRRWLNPRAANADTTPTPTDASGSPEEEGDGNRKEGAVRSIKPSKLPPFCYNVEVQRTGQSDSSRELQDIPRFELARRFFNNKGRSVNDAYTSPVDYTLIIHPPIILENLLPTGGIFELMHATHRSVIWSAYLAAGETKQIHTVTMDVPLILLINLRYCRTLNGTLIHKPMSERGAGRGIASKIQRTFETLLDEDDRLPEDIVLTDTVGQRLRLQLDNTEGGGGQRHVVVYCPYWIVNTSQYQMRIREEGKGDKDLPAGSVTREKDGTRAVVLSNSYGLDKPGQGSADAKSPAKLRDFAAADGFMDQTIFCGRPGGLHSSQTKEFTHDSPEMRLLQELPFKDITSLAFMFNYEFHNDKGLLANLANRKVTVQLDDSDWSPSFSMDSAGIDQAITIESPRKGVLEVGFHSKVAPGRLAKYTKVIRFMPRFVLVNNMGVGLSVVQPSMFLEGDFLGSGAHQEPVSPGCLRPYHLPNIEGERHLAIKLDGPWSRSVSFKVDVSDAYSLLLKRKVDLSAVPHVHTRGDSEYLVVLPPRELGVFFETDFNEENITIKSLKNDSFASRKTDMQVGDALLAIDGIEFNGKRFAQAMEMLKEKLKSTGCAVKFRTNEERMRVIRNRQLNPGGGAPVKRGSIAGAPGAEDDELAGDAVKVIKVDIKTVEASVVITISAVDKTATSEYVITNGSASHVLHYKQQDIAGNQWSQLVPGKSAKFVWENPFKLRRLLVRAGRNLLCPRAPPPEDSADMMSVAMNELGEDLVQLSGLNPLMYLAGFAGINETKNISVNLDEIGFAERMPLPESSGELCVAIVSEGPTKTLKVAPEENVRDLIYSSEFMSAQIDHLEAFGTKLRALRDKERENKQQNIEVRPWSISPLIQLQMTSILELLQAKQKKLVESLSHRGGQPADDAPAATLSAYAPFESVLGLDICDSHQLVVEIFEAKELAPFVTGQKENIYCKIYLKTSEKHLRAACKKPAMTYVCSQTLDPSWIDQKFVLPVPEYAQGQPRSFTLRVVILCRGLVRNARVLGKVDVQLSCLQNERRLKGWFPVSVKNSSTRSARIQTDAVGSIRMSCQWVHSSQGLSDYILSSVDRRVAELKENLRTQYRVLKKLNVEEAQKLRSGSGVSMSGKYGTTADPSSRDVASSAHDIFSGVKKMKGILVRATDQAWSTVHSRHSAGHSAGDASTEELEQVSGRGSSTPSPRPRGTILFTDEAEAEAEAEFDSIERVLKRSEVSLDSEPVLPRPTPYSTGVEGHRRRLSLRALGATVTSLFRNYDQVASKHKRHLAVWLAKPRPSHVTRHMQRREHIVSDNAAFRQRMAAESRRNISHINALKGRLEITPLQALHVSDPNTSRKPLLVRVSYGERYEDTFSLPPAADLSWFQELAPEVEGEKGAFAAVKDLDTNSLRRYQNERLKKIFDIDKLNVKGNVCVLIMVEDLPYNREIARVELPIFTLLDCICTLDDGACYDRWFPVTLSGLALQAEGMADAHLQSEEIDYRVFGYSPCIRLRLRWEHAEDAPVAVDSKFSLRLQLPSASMAIVDSAHAAELIQLSLAGVEIHHSISAKYTDSMVNVTWLQIDNQLPDPLAPVILAPAPQKFPQPVIRLNMRKNNLLSVEFLTSYDAFDLIVQELDCKIEQLTVVALRSLLQGWLHEHKSRMGSADAAAGQRDDVFDLGSENGSSSQSVESVQTSPRRAARDELSAGDASDDQQNKLYVKNFMIGPMKINVSFLMSSQVHSASEDSASRGEAQRAALRDHDGLISTLSVFVWQVGDVIKDLTSTISDAPIYIYGFKGNHMFVTDVELSRRLQSHYFQYLLRQVYKIVGSLDIVGNPIGLVSSLGVGVRDFFFEPGKALIANPTELSKIGRGVFKGALSLVSNTTDGFIGTGTTFTRGLGRGIAKLSMDATFIRSREELLRPPRNIPEAMRRPYKDVSNALYYAASGIFRVPYLSFKRNRPSTVVIGLIKGVVGTAPKIIVGGLDAVTHTGDVLREIVKTFTHEHATPVNRRRLGNLFGPDGRIMPYCSSTAQGTNILALLDRVSREHAIGNAIQESSRLVIVLRNVLRMGPGDSDEERQRQAPRQRMSASFTGLMAPQRSVSGKRSVLSDSEDVDSRSDTSPAKRQDMITDDKLLSDIRNRSKVEFVVHTTIISNNSSINTETIVVLSTARVVVTEYYKKNGASVIGLLYQCMLGSLKPPVFERSGSGATLTLSTSSAAQANSKRSEGPTLTKRGKGKVVAQRASGDYVIQCNDEEKLIVLNNCISTVTGAFDNIIPYYKPYDTQFVEDIDGRIHIGSWEYSRDPDSAQETDTSIAAFETEAIRTRLSNERWHFFDDRQGSERVPRWLVACRASAVRAHSCVAELRALLDAHSDAAALQANPPLQLLLLQLKGGLISSEDFFERLHDLGEVLPGADEFEVSRSAEVGEDGQARLSTLGRGIGMVAGSAKSVLAFSAKTIQSAADTVSSGVSAAAAATEAGARSVASIPKLASAAATRTLSPAGLTKATSFYVKSSAPPPAAERRDSSGKEAESSSSSSGGGSSSSGGVSAVGSVPGDRISTVVDPSTEKAGSVLQAEEAAGIGSRVSNLMERFSLATGRRPSGGAQDSPPTSPSRTALQDSPALSDVNTSAFSGANDSLALLMVLDRLEKLEKLIRERDEKR